MSIFYKYMDNLENFDIKTINTRDYYDLMIILAERKKESIELRVEPGKLSDVLQGVSYSFLRDIMMYWDEVNKKPEALGEESRIRGLSLFRKLYLPGGPFYQIPMSRLGYASPEGIVKYSPLVHLVITEPQHFGQLRDSVFSNIVTWMLLRPGLLKTLNRQMDKLAKVEQTIPFTDVVAHACQNIHLYINSYQSVAGVQKIGGLPWLKKNGANIALCLQRFLDGIEDTQKVVQVNNKSFGLIFDVIMDCIKELENTGELSLEDAKLKRGSLLTSALQVSGRQKNKDVEFWRPIIKEAMISSTAQPDVRQILSYAYFTPDQDVDQDLCISVCRDQMAEVKRVIKRDYAIMAQYEVIVSAGIKELFKPAELLAFMGRTFSADLGI